MALTEAWAKALSERRLQEAADSGDMSHNDLCKWLSDAVRENRPSGSWCYFIDFIGDGESGTVQYCCDGSGTMQCPYTITQSNGKCSVDLDMDKAEQVYQTTTYIPVGEDNGYGALEAAGLYTKGDVPLCERTINKAERDAADSGSFAGKGQSFPILKKGDAKAAAASIGRAGPGNKSKDALKASIKRIAKKKGLASELPQTWKDEDKAAEAARVAEAGARHSKADMDKIQAIHDHIVDLGATCDDDDDDPDDSDSTATEARVSKMLSGMGVANPKAIIAEFLSEAAPKKAAQAMHDKATNQKAHDASVKLGAACPDDCKFGDGPDDSDASESAQTARARGKRLLESAQMNTATLEFRESAAISPMVKIISPGRGSSGYYTKEVLERDGPTVFDRGTLMFVNHATKAEQESRPEGDWTKLAAVTEGRAQWMDNGPDGPALYAPAAVFSKFAEEVKEKAPYTGVSINAYGQYAESKTGLPNPKVKYHESKLAPDGKPGLIAKLTAADSIDLVTKAGRDGKLLLESAGQSTNQPQENDMDAAELRKLQEGYTAQQAEIRRLRDREALREAATPIADYLRTVSASQPIKDKVTQRVLERCVTPPLTDKGELDHAQVKKFAEAELLEQLDLLRRINPSLVTGMGPSTASGAPTKESLKEAKVKAKAEKKAVKESRKRFASMVGFESNGVQKFKMGRQILNEGRRAFRPEYNARLHGGVINGASGSLPGLEA